MLVREGVVEQIEMVHADERDRTVGTRIALHQRELFGLVDRVLEADRAPMAAPFALERLLGHLANEAVVLAAIGNEVADRADLHAVQLRKGYEIIEARHRAVVLHDLADNARRIEAREARNVDRSLGVARAHEDAAIACGQRKDMAGRADRIGTVAGIDGDRNGPRAIVRANPGGDAFLRLDGDGEGGLERRFVACRHGAQAEFLHPLACEREADQPATVLRHERDLLRRRHLRGNDEVALIFAVFVVDEDEHAPVARLLDDFLDRGQRGVAVSTRRHGRLHVGLNGYDFRVGHSGDPSLSTTPLTPHHALCLPTRARGERHIWRREGSDRARA